LLGSTQRAAQNPSVIVAKEGIITTKHRQTLAQAAFNFQINDHRELLQSFPSVTKKTAKCFCLFSGMPYKPQQIGEKFQPNTNKR